jgi:uncharacterized membrane protein YfcA
MAPLRVLMVSVANGAAVAWFVGSGAVWWPQTLAMLGASAVGGYIGARLTQWMPPHVVRGFVVVLSATVTILFFLRAF